MKLVEEAARELWKRNGTEDEWDDLNEDTKESWRNQARAIVALFLAALRREPSQAAMDKVSELPCFQVINGWLAEMQAVRGRKANWTLDNPPLAQAWSAMVAERVKEWGE